MSMGKETLSNILDLLIEVAGEQATRELSGINWYNDFSARLSKVRNDINKCELACDCKNRREIFERYECVDCGKLYLDK